MNMYDKVMYIDNSILTIIIQFLICTALNYDCFTGISN